MRPEREHIAARTDVSWFHHVRRGGRFEFRWHAHPEIELTLITHGHGTRIVGDSIEDYQPGDLTLIGSEVPHTYVSAANGVPDPRVREAGRRGGHADGSGGASHEAVVVQFRRDFLGKDLFDRGEFACVGGLLDAASRGLAFTATPDGSRTLRGLAELPAAERTLALLRVLVELVGMAGRPLSTLGVGRKLSRPAQHRVDAVCTYLQEHYTRPLQLAEVAAVAHMSPTAFSRFFRRALGRTMTDYVTELRIAAACRLLADSDLPVGNVASRCGYDNLSNFNRRFRALKHASPSEYRRALRSVSSGQDPVSSLPQ